jgi:hypothetical protein
MYLKKKHFEKQLLPLLQTYHLKLVVITLYKIINYKLYLVNLDSDA